jgi:hypothetical protein
LIINHYRIQIKIISYIRDWHCISKTLDPVAEYLATHLLFWQYLFKEQTTSKILNKRSRISRDMQKGLRKTVRRRSLAKLTPKLDEGQTIKTCAQGPWQLADKNYAANQRL